MRRRSMPLFLLIATLAWSCATSQTEYKVLRHSTYSYPYPTMHLYVAPETDRSGGRYHDVLSRFELVSFQERIADGLQRRSLSFDSYTSAGSPTRVKLTNPYTIVNDSTQADLILYLRIDALEEGEVEVTRDRVMVWYGYGISRFYDLSSRVPRVLIALDGQLKEVSTGQIFYGFQARGVSVDRAFRREGIEVAMARCEKRFCEKLLRR